MRIQNILNPRYSFFILVLSLFLSFMGCSTSECTRDQLKAPKSENIEKLKVNKSMSVKVYKYDGSIQCEPGTGKTLQQMQESDLKGVIVLSSEKLNDGLMRTQVCGQITGQCNVYEIEERSLELALRSGFKVWNNN